jgi:Ser/Thr protein kinase RdoA (MazF antagonist)
VDAESSRIVGVLDFGDMQIAPRVCDLAIACSYLTGPATDPFCYVESTVAAYHRENPLDGGDSSMLVDLIAMRHAMTILITEWRAKRHPESAGYILRNNPSARRGLTAFDAVGRRALAQRLSEALSTRGVTHDHD